MESRGGGELASLLEDDPGGVKEEASPFEAERFWGNSCREEPPPTPDEDKDSCDGNGNDEFGGVWIPKRPWMYSGSYFGK